MTPEDLGFLQAILSHPDDDTNRLVYADWLEERGDGRAAFLRTEVRLAATDPGDPAYVALEAELRALIPALDAAWLAAVGKCYDLLLEGYPPASTILTIKLIREYSGVGLKEAKDLAEAPLPVVVPCTTQSLADALRAVAQFRQGTRVRPLPARSLRPDAYHLFLEEYPPAAKHRTIKLIREYGYLDLKDAKELSETLPAVISCYLSLADAEQAVGRFAEGTRVRPRPTRPVGQAMFDVQHRALGAGFRPEWLPGAQRRYDLYVGWVRSSFRDYLAGVLHEIAGTAPGPVRAELDRSRRDPLVPLVRGLTHEQFFRSRHQFRHEPAISFLEAGPGS
jgi:uncharacterized protein (TIGR02996 family)